MLRKWALITLWAGVTLGVTGCMPKMTIEQMKQQMPQRPAELDRLDAFVGKWQGEGEAKFAFLDTPLRITGTTQMEWGGNRWFIVGKSVMGMEHFDDMYGLETWTYDAHAKKYRSTWVDSMGSSGTGESTYDEKAGVWHMKAKSHGAWGESTMKGTLRFTNPDTMEWSIEEWQGLMKVSEMNGTSKRVK